MFPLAGKHGIIAGNQKGQVMAARRQCFMEMVDTMCDLHNDLTYNDFNPTILFASKLKMTTEDKYHCHRDFTELTIILSGKGGYYVEGTTYEVEAGDIIICNPGMRHRNIIVNKAEPTVEFFTGFYGYHFKNMPPGAIVLEDGGCLLRLPSDARHEVLKQCYAMLAENEACQVGKYFMLKAYLMQILLIMMREIVGTPQQKQQGCNFESYNKSYAVKKIVNYLNESYGQKISLDQIAHNMYLSPVYVSKIFKEETGESPINYLIKIRLEKARDILAKEGAGSIKSIANAVGYEDVYHFSKLFKKYYSISPQNYRKEVQEKMASGE